MNLNIGAIDIGSNAIRLLIGTVIKTENGTKINKTSFIRVPIRLGKDVFSKGKISKNKIEKLEKSLMAFKLIMEVYGVEIYRSCATSAMRDAENGPEIVEHIKNNTGIGIEVIEGYEEANLIFKKIYSQNLDLRKNYLFVDVGGGSTEITVVKQGEQIKSKSFNIGTIRKVGANDLMEEWEELGAWLKDFNDNEVYEMIGSGGNINKIIKLLSVKGIRETTYSDLKEFVSYLGSFSVKERIVKLGLRPDRADVIVPAGEIFLYIMKLAKIEILIAPKIGLTDGIIHDLHEKYLVNTEN